MNKEELTRHIEKQFKDPRKISGRAELQMKVDFSSLLQAVCEQHEYRENKPVPYGFILVNKGYNDEGKVEKVPIMTAFVCSGLTKITRNALEVGFVFFNFSLVRLVSGQQAILTVKHSFYGYGSSHRPGIEVEQASRLMEFRAHKQKDIILKKVNKKEISPLRLYDSGMDLSGKKVFLQGFKIFKEHSKVIFFRIRGEALPIDKLFHSNGIEELFDDPSSIYCIYAPNEVNEYMDGLSGSPILIRDKIGQEKVVGVYTGRFVFAKNSAGEIGTLLYFQTVDHSMLEEIT